MCAINFMKREGFCVVDKNLQMWPQTVDQPVLDCMSYIKLKIIRRAIL